MPVEHDLDLLLAHTRALKAILEERANDRRASDAARENARSFDLSVASAEVGDVACRHGCAHCCHGYVSATAPELFLLAREIRSLPPPDRQGLESRLVATLETTGGLNAEQRFQLTMPCPLLERDLCCVYPLRPLNCRAMASRAVEDCIRVLIEKREEPIRVPKASMSLRNAHAVTLRAALRLTGYDDHRYELVCGLVAALDYEGSEARWLAGEPVFDGLTQENVTTRSEELDPVVDAILAGAGGADRD